MNFKIEYLKYFSFTTVILNLLTVICGIIYFAIPIYSIFWNFFGAIMIITWLVNFALLFINDQFLVKSDETGKKINRLCYFFLLFYIVAMLLLVTSELALALTISTEPIAFTLPNLLIFISFFGISAFGLFLAYLDITNLEKRGVWKFE